MLEKNSSIKLGSHQKYEQRYSSSDRLDLPPPLVEDKTTEATARVGGRLLTHSSSAPTALL